MRLKVIHRHTDVGRITDLNLVPVSDSAFQLDFTLPETAAHAEISIDGGAKELITPGMIFGGLTAATAYTAVPWAIDDVGRRGPAGTADTETTLADVPNPGTTNELAAEASGPTTATLTYPPLTNSPIIQHRWAMPGDDITTQGTAWATLDTLTNEVSNLPSGETGVQHQIRGVSADLSEQGTPSNTATSDQPSPAGTNMLVTYGTSAERAEAISVYGTEDLIICPQVVGLTRPLNTFTDYPVEAVFSEVDGGAIDILDYDNGATAADVAAWVAAGEAADLPIVAGAGTYPCNGLQTISRLPGIFGKPGEAKPIFDGDWRHYFAGGSQLFRVQGIKRINCTLPFIWVDEGPYMTSTRYGYSWLNNSVVRENAAPGQLVGIDFFDNDFDTGVCPLFVGSELRRITRGIRFGRNYATNCNSLMGGRAAFFGDPEDVEKSNLWYLNHLDGGFHNKLGTYWGAGILFGSETTANTNTDRETNGAQWFENNRIEEIYNTIVPKADDDQCVGCDLRSSNQQYQQFNELINIRGLHAGCDTNPFYKKGTTKTRWNYISGCGSDPNYPYGDQGAGSMTEDGYDTDAFPGGEAQVISKGGGGSGLIGRSEDSFNFVRCHLGFNGPVFSNRHTAQYEGNVVSGWHGGCVRVASRRGMYTNLGNNIIMKKNYEIDCALDPYRPRQEWLGYNDGGNPGAQADGVRSNFDGRTDVFNGYITIADSRNVADTQNLTNEADANQPPACSNLPDVTIVGGDLVISSNGNWRINLDNATAYANGFAYEWLRAGEPIPDEDTNTLAAAEWTDTIEAVVIGTTAASGKQTKAKALPRYVIEEELCPLNAVATVPASWSSLTRDNLFKIKGATTSSADFTFTSPLEAGEIYRVQWNQDLTGSTTAAKLTVTILGGGRKIPICIWNRLGYFVFEFTALAGETGVRFTAGQNFGGCTISQISVGKIVGYVDPARVHH